MFTGAINTACVERNAVVMPVSGGGPEGTAQVTDEFDCPEGTLFNQATVTSTAQLDPTTCLFRQPQSGTFRFTGGTGQFAGATAQGTLQALAIGLLQRGPEGCNLNAPPVFVFLVVNFTGNISVP